MTGKIFLTQEINGWISCKEFLKHFRFFNERIRSIEGTKTDANFFEINIADACVFRYIYKEHMFTYDIYKEISLEAWKEIVSRYILPLCFCDIGWLVLHATQIVSQNKDFSFMLLGPSGVGKSTLTYELFRSGFEVVSDDMVVLDERGISRWYNPCIKLTADACKHFSVDYTGKTNKERIVMQGTLLKNPWRCSKLFILSPIAGKKDIEVVPIIGRDKIIELYSSFYNIDIISSEIRKKQTNKLVAINRKLDVYKIIYEKNYENMESIRKVIEEIINE